MKVKNNFKLIVAITDSGGGHRASANALKCALEGMGLPWEVKIVNITEEVLNEGWAEFIYNSFILKMGLRKLQWKLYIPILLKVIKIKKSIYKRKLDNFWRKEKPNLVVSMMPLINKLLQESLEEYNPSIDFYTIITDFIDNPPNYWIENINQKLICPTVESYNQAIEIGVDEESLYNVSGVVIHPDFYNMKADSYKDCIKNRLDKNKKTALLLFGGQGSNDVTSWIKEMEKFHKELQVIVICGHNESLYKKLSKMELMINKIVIGFTKNVSYYMEVSDFFIGKPGPGCIAEAIQKKLPIITELDCNTLDHERFNSKWVATNNVGIVIQNKKEIQSAIAMILQRDNYEFYLENINEINNSSIFEVIDILKSKLYAFDSTHLQEKILV